MGKEGGTYWSQALSLMIWFFSSTSTICWRTMPRVTTTGSELFATGRSNGL